MPTREPEKPVKACQTLVLKAVRLITKPVIRNIVQASTTPISARTRKASFPASSLPSRRSAASPGKTGSAIPVHAQTIGEPIITSIMPTSGTLVPPAAFRLAAAVPNTALPNVLTATSWLIKIPLKAQAAQPVPKANTQPERTVQNAHTELMPTTPEPQLVRVVLRVGQLPAQKYLAQPLSRLLVKNARLVLINRPSVPALVRLARQPNRLLLKEALRKALASALALLHLVPPFLPAKAANAPDFLQSR